ncbi:hypothetical protein CVT24_002685 [Panaeolus cyanescens]|uniref:Uncharacterized protein n=1 Tax=Panaeolus cyanescens TaxID=181874 RepID=A0A409WBC0_9AGAR|nr:hypothetical protein CVT24_002685 [Panaeolus cyanescens]
MPSNITSSPDSLRPTSPSSPPPPMDLRHMTSNGLLSSPTRDNHHAKTNPNRLSQHYRSTDLKVAPSIPSSPTSIHSSSSAIFERDIEPIIPPSPPSTLHNPPNPHRIPRAKHTGQIEQSVPSVLDSAASVLATLDDTDPADQVAVVAPMNITAEMGDSLGLGLGGSSSLGLSLGMGLPSQIGQGATRSGSGFASPIGSLRSRSPSPLGMRLTGGTAGTSATATTTTQQSQPLNLAIPVPHQTSQQMSIGLSMEAVSSSPPQPHSIPSRSPSMGSPATRARSISPSQNPQQPNSPSLLPITMTHSTSSTHNPTSPTTLSHPPSPAHGPKKRLSFMSYTDLLASTPSTTQPLSSLTSNASTSEPPPHIPTVSMVNVALSANASRAASVTGSPLSSPVSLPGATGVPSLRNVSGVASVISQTSVSQSHASAVGGPVGGLTHPGMKESIALLDNVGGEWEREGMGLGLEERLGIVGVVAK